MGLRPYNYQDYIDIFADNLKELMEQKGFNQKTLAEAAYLSASAISKYLHKNCLPNMAIVINLATALGCEIDELIDFGAILVE